MATLWTQSPLGICLVSSIESPTLREIEWVCISPMDCFQALSHSTIACAYHYSLFFKTRIETNIFARRKNFTLCNARFFLYHLRILSRRNFFLSTRDLISLIGDLKIEKKYVSKFEVRLGVE